MKVHLRKSAFARNKEREHNNNFFNKIHKNLSSLTHIGFAILLAPTIVISSFISQTFFLMIANIFLSMGFMFDFLHRIYHNEISYLEILLSIIAIALLFLLAFYLTPMIGGWTVLGTLCFINLFSSSITSFFLIRNLVIPPLLSLIRLTAKSLGFEIKETYYSPLFTFEHDPTVIPPKNN